MAKSQRDITALQNYFTTHCSKCGRIGKEVDFFYKNNKPYCGRCKK
jgi:formylmethanofuran dehydrogenase subunit E